MQLHYKSLTSFLRIVCCIITLTSFNSCQSQTQSTPANNKEIPSHQKQALYVTRIIDGDTFVGIDAEQNNIKVRLWGIDAPERQQAFYQKSKQALAQYIHNQTVYIENKGKDRFKRTLAVVYTSDNKDINYEMIKSGMAWHFTQYSQTKSYQEAQGAAQKASKGLWADKAPTAPWVYRKQK